ncbi:isocitrate/isopropylmalate dehydrogenase family protein [Amycolatopsis sp. NPDC049868]|uniref:isocitrate/isopropylmalate dehydrogenase family protein n=1 Tax=Amycolatopsis sp. NPDC049868 TaxID=3363934 RepID=UPI0037AC1E7B
MTTYTFALLPGDGIGVEVVAQARRVLDAAAELEGLEFRYDEIPCGAKYYLEHGADWPEGSRERCASADAILLGAIGWPAEDGSGTTRRADGRMAGWEAIVGNRAELELYANIRPVKLLPGIQHMISGTHRNVWAPEDVDMVFVRENSEDLYAGIGGVRKIAGRQEVAIDTRIITRTATERIMVTAFDIARRRAAVGRRRRVTCVVKDNVLLGCRLFVDVFHEIGQDYPEVEREVVLVDAFTQWLVRHPEKFDVVVAPNMFGDIITELASALQGGIGMASGCNIGDRHGMFEPIHGSAPPIAGQNRANPMATILAAAQALTWLSDKHSDPVLATAGGRIEAAVRSVVREGQTLTYDLVGTERASSTSEVTTAVIAALKADHAG